MSKSRCHYNQARQRWKRVSREDDVRLSRFGILGSHTFCLSPSFLPVSCSPSTRPPAASPRANRAVLSASAVSKCQSNRERSRPRLSSRQLRIHHEQVKGDVLLHVLAQVLCLCPDTSSRCTAEKSQHDFSPEFQVPGGFHKLPGESSRLEADQLWLGARESPLE